MNYLLISTSLYSTLLPLLEAAYIIRTAWHPPLTEHCHVFAWAVNSRQLNIFSLFALKLFIQVNFAQKMVTITVWMPRAWSKCGRKLQTLLFINRSSQIYWYCSRNRHRRMILFITWDFKKHKRRKFVYSVLILLILKHGCLVRQALELFCSNSDLFGASFHDHNLLSLHDEVHFV